MKTSKKLTVIIKLENFMIMKFSFPNLGVTNSIFKMESHFVFGFYLGE